MTSELIIAGFGGQGILFMGQALAYAANNAGKNVSWLPSYGPEMRGGTANCNIVISDTPVNSPLVLAPDILVAMNKPSLKRFEPQIKPGGCLVINKDMVDVASERGDVRIVEVEADTLAAGLGNAKAANMVALGTLVGFTGILSLEETVEAFRQMTPQDKAKIIPANVEALKKGFEVGAKAKQEG